MERLLDSILKQGRTLLFSFVECLPFIIMLVNLFVYIIFGAFLFSDIEDERLLLAGELIDQLCEVSLYSLVLMLILSAKWRVLSKLSFVCLCALWVLNTVYIAFSWNPEIYFYSAMSLIYIIFVILTVYILINR